MRVEATHNGSPRSDMKEHNARSFPSGEDVGTGQPVPSPFKFSVCMGLVTSEGDTEEACLAVLLEHLMMHIQHEPCDEFRRAYYHLVMAQESLKHHRCA
jgi:hypothetical protein